MKVKLAELGQPKTAQIRPVESLSKIYTTRKSHKITGKSKNVSIVLIKKNYLIRVFIQSQCNCGCLVSYDAFTSIFLTQLNTL